MQDTPTFPDNELLDAFIRRRSEPAFAELVHRHANWVFAAAFRQLHDRQLAEDVTQGVFLLLCQKAGNMGRQHKLSGWLFNATQYAVLGVTRSRARRDRLERQAARLASIPPPQSESDLVEHLDHAVAKLSSADRTLVVLRFYRGMELGQIADSLQISQAAARKRLTRAVGRLRKLLGGPVPVESLSCAATFGLQAAPVQLAHTIGRVVLGSSGGAALPTGAGAAAKGALHAMSVVKLKVAAAVIISVTLLPASALLLQQRSSATAAPPLPAAPAPATAPILANDTLPADYQLSGDQALRHVSPPYKPGRAKFYQSIFAFGVPGKALANDPEPQSIMLETREGRFASGNLTRDRDLNLADVIRHLLKMYPQELEGDENVLNTPLPGDYVYSGDAPEDQRRAAIENLMAADFHAPVSLVFRDVQRSVIVFRGKWTAPAIDHLVGGHAMISFFPPPAPGAKPNRRGRSLQIGYATEFTGWLGRYLGRQVILEADDLPKQFLWEFKDDGSGLPLANLQGVDPPTAFKSIHDQTGLSETIEERTVRRLFVERAGL